MALKRAQQVLREEYPDPYRWAAFVAQGAMFDHVNDLN
jgi:CHAT domain-containing protein